MPYTVTIRDIQELAPDIKQFRVDRPANYNFVPGQATQIAIDDPDRRENTRPGKGGPPATAYCQLFVFLW